MTQGFYYILHNYEKQVSEKYLDIGIERSQLKFWLPILLNM